MFKSNIPTSSTSKSAARREELRRTLPRPSLSLLRLLQRPELFHGLLVTVLFVLVSGALVVWSREQVKVSVGQVMRDTRLHRQSYTVENEVKTTEAQQRARDLAPLVYGLNKTHLDNLRTPLLNLPVVVDEQQDLAMVSAETKQAFALDEAALTALKPYARDKNPTAQWAAWVEKLLTRVLPARPLIDSKEWQNGLNKPQLPILRNADGAVVPTNWRDAIQIPDGSTQSILTEVESRIVREAGFPPEVAKYVAARLVSDVKPTFVLDSAATAAAAQRAADAVETVKTNYRKGEIIYRRGDRLTSQQYEEVVNEAIANNARAMAEIWQSRVGTIGLISILSLLVAGYIAYFYRRVVENALRAVALTALLCSMLAVAVIGTVEGPNYIYVAAVAPTLVVAIIALLAYDQRLALFLSSVQSMLVVLAVDRGVGLFILLFAGCATMIAQLRDVRHRNTVIRASVVTAFVLGLGAIAVELASTPLVKGAGKDILFSALCAAGASVGTGFFILGILPSVEKLFDITTGMTLAELRDPRQPLLRQLQQKAPGTCNHSLQVANIAEAAAEAIGANSLLTYVGALYHDIGKMNKPDYFIENISGGPSKHEKLSPAMSLLVIIGHVKDGIQLAREYGLPRQVQQFIESHHGTTLVEYFYHAAKNRARAASQSAVDEVEFRYPGPKPRTKETAILMLADAVESTCRCLSEPTPSRIENVVRELARKRLRDGQFDQADLTFRELNQIEESLIKSVLALYHGRISYPTSETVQPTNASAKTASA